MSRLYLTCWILLLSSTTLGQTAFSKLFLEGNNLYHKGDYYYALDFYEKAYAIDSNSVELLWKMAETYAAYKDYRKAEEFFGRVYKKEEGLLFPNSLLCYGLMQKMNGKYELALETFKSAKKKYAGEKKDYFYLKAKKEVESCVFAMNEVENNKFSIEPFSDFVNTEDTEFGHTFAPNGVFIFSSLKADSVSSAEEVYSNDYSTRLYQYDRKNATGQPTSLDALNVNKQNTGNGSFSKDGRRFYYSLCNDKKENYTCKIMVAKYSNGEWSEPDSLGEIINIDGFNTTMPSVQEINGIEYLFFSSDREGGVGGMDIYYSQIKNGNQYSKPKNISSINSVENDLSPFFDPTTNRLYFSSTWHSGLGGLDVFYSNYVDDAFRSPVNAGLPINSSANDLYFFINKEKSYVTSNRLGVKFSKNPTCCSDIFEISTKKPPKDTLIVIKETLEELNKRLPVTLYFHNDEPNPRSLDTTTKINYENSNKAYRAMLEKYQEEYAKGLSGQEAQNAKEDIESFFIEYVDQGVKDLHQFRDLLLEGLQKGKKINVTIKGFASPLAKSDYNVNLTKRRISSLQNYLMQYQDSVFAPFFLNKSTSGGLLTFTEVPFGEDKSNKLVSDNLNDQKNSVYSRAAALERKIEVQSVNFIEPVVDSLDEKIELLPIDSLDTLQTGNVIPPRFDTTVVNVGKISAGKKVKVSYKITNDKNTLLEVENIRVPCNCSDATISKSIIVPNESAVVEFTFDPEGYAGEVVKSIYVKFKGYTEEIRLVLLTEVIP